MGRDYHIFCSIALSMPYYLTTNFNILLTVYQHCAKEGLIKNNEIAALIKGDRDFVEETVRYQNNILTFNNVPVIMDGHRVGRVFSFQNVNRLQELEGKIRGKIYSKGHRAKYSISDILGTRAEIEKAKKTC